jgi:uncharacterized membrane protein
VNISAVLLPPVWYLLAHVLLFAAIVAFVLRAPWRKLGDGAFSHLWLGACVSLLVLWSIRSPVIGGIEFHFLGATAVTLMFGPGLAIGCLAVVMVGRLLMGQIDPGAFSMDVLLLAVLPVALSHATLRLSQRLFPPNLFIYIFAAAFFGAGIAMLGSGGATVGLHAIFGTPGEAMMAELFLPYCLLLGFAEATLTGMVVTLLVVYRPSWVGTFDDARYLLRR